MSTHIVIAFFFFSVSMTITPGAGNLILLGISNRYGFLAALPFVAGTAFGVLIVFAGTSAGLLKVLVSAPELYTALKFIGAFYLLYIAWNIANDKIDEDESIGQPSGFFSGTLIQVSNPKAWIAAMTVFSQFTDTKGDYLTQVSIIIIAFLLVTIFCTTVWAYFGTVLKHLLHSPKQMAVINRCLGGSLAVTVIYMLSQTN